MVYLYFIEGVVSQQFIVFMGERYVLCYCLINDIVVYFCQVVDICFLGMVVVFFNGIVKQVIDVIIVILVVFGGINIILSGDIVCLVGVVVECECFYFVVQFVQCSCCSSVCKICIDNDDFDVVFVVGCYQIYGIVVMCLFFC